jgi:uncharacterized protein (UPF0248 family)
MTYLNGYQKCKTKKSKLEFLNMMKYHFTEDYNTYKNVIKKSNQSKSLKISINHIQNVILLLNSIIKNNNNIIENFSKFKLSMELLMEHTEENEDKLDIYVGDTMTTLKAEQGYLFCCDRFKMEYEMYKFMIEDFNKIKL